jgi:hypothetical protein
MAAFPDRDLIELWFDFVRCYFGAFKKVTGMKIASEYGSENSGHIFKCLCFHPRTIELKMVFSPNTAAPAGTRRRLFFYLAHRHR